MLPRIIVNACQFLPLSRLSSMDRDLMTVLPSARQIIAAKGHSPSLRTRCGLRYFSLGPLRSFARRRAE